jgi:hypothetical protein
VKQQPAQLMSKRTLIAAPRVRTLLLVPLILLAGCERDSGDNLRDSYERMMASAERRAVVAEAPPIAADTPLAQAAPLPDTAAAPSTLPIDTLPTAAAAEPDPAPRAFEGTAGIEQRQRSGSPSTLRSVRSAEHDGFDRVVFEFEGAIPGYHIEYIDRPVLECGSGRTIQVAGQGWLRVHLEPARAHEVVDGFAQVTVASRNRTLDHGIVQQLVLTCDFEGQVEWVAGVAAPNQYRLLQLSEPSRLVVDINH